MHPKESSSAPATEAHSVVMNAEGQYSIWPHGLSLPMGWSEAGFSGGKAQCLEFVQTQWVDMRPLSLRRSLDSTKDA